MKSTNNISLTIIATMLILMWSACYYDEVVPGAKIEDVGVMSFTKDIIPIFNNSCNMSGCHNTGGQAPDLSAGNAFNTLTNDGYINTSNAKNSSLYKWMNNEESLSMPLTGPNATYNAKVLAWIEQGASNN